MTRLRKIGPEAVPPPQQRKRRGGARILRGTDGRPMRARRTKEPAGFGVRMLRVGAVLLVCTFFLVMWTRPVSQIEVRGVWLSSSDFVTAMLEPELGRRWVTTPVKDFARELERDPWIDRAQVIRAPGSRLLVKIREAEPVFCVELGDQRRLLDRDGDLLPPCDDLFIEALPVVRGLDIGLEGLSEESRDQFLHLLGALDGTGWVWAEGLAHADLRDPDEVVLESRKKVQVVVKLDDAPDQLAAAAAVWSQLDTEGPTRVDLRFENQIVLSH
jgi:cell division septal protein FtsQ